MGQGKVNWTNGWTYGNWGGQGWSGGKFTSPREMVDRRVDGVDQLDRSFKVHDIGYENASTAYEASAKTKADYLHFLQAVDAADKKLIQSIQALVNTGALNSLPNALDRDGSLDASFEALTLFVALQPSNAIQIGLASLPDDAGLQGDSFTRMFLPGSYDDISSWMMQRDLTINSLLAQNEVSQSPSGSDSAHLVRNLTSDSFALNAGGNLWNVYQIQKNLSDGIATWSEYRTAIQIANPGVNLTVLQPGQVIHNVTKASDGSNVYHLAGGVTYSVNDKSGEFHMTTADGSGLVTQVSKEYSSDGPQGPGYYTKNAEYFHGQLTTETVAYQRALDSDVSSITRKTLETGADGQPVYTYKDLLNKPAGDLTSDITVHDTSTEPTDPLGALIKQLEAKELAKEELGIATTAEAASLTLDNGVRLTVKTVTSGASTASDTADEGSGANNPALGYTNMRYTNPAYTTATSATAFDRADGAKGYVFSYQNGVSMTETMDASGKVTYTSTEVTTEGGKQVTTVRSVIEWAASYQQFVRMKAHEVAQTMRTSQSQRRGLAHRFNYIKSPWRVAPTAHVRTA